MDDTFTFILDDETEKRLFELLTDVDVSKTPSFSIKDKHGNEAEYVKAIRCKDCKWWRQQTNYQGTPLSFGFCESDDMWRSLYGETTEVAHIDTDDNHYCGYAKRKEE